MSVEVNARAVLLAEALVEAVDDGRLDVSDEPWLQRVLADYRRVADPTS